MTRPPRHLHLIHNQEPELEAEAGWNWVLILAVLGCVLVWATIIAGVVLLLV